MLKQLRNPKHFIAFLLVGVFALFSVGQSGDAQANEAPIAVGSIPNQTLQAGVSDPTANANSYFSDPDGDALTYSASSSDSSVASASMSGSSLTITTVSAGTTTITITASDSGGLTATQSFSITVTGSTQTPPPQNSAPTGVGSIPSQTLQAGGSGTTVSVDSYFSDPDGDALTYSASSSDSSIASASLSGSSLTVTAAGAGSTTISVTASDSGGLTATQSFSITVTGSTQTPPPQNSAPTTVGSISVSTLQVAGGLKSITVSVDSYFSDPDGDALTYSASSSDSSIASASLWYSSLTVTAVGAGTTTISVTASDSGGLTATQSFSVTVTGSTQTPQNRAPTAVGSIPNQTLQVGVSDPTANADSYFSDPDGDALTYSASSSDSSVASASMSGSSLTITTVSAGSTTITVTASDSGGLTATQSFSITVTGSTQTPQNQAPTAVSSIPNQTLQVGGNTTVSADSYFSDPDGDALTYSASSSDSSVASASVSGLSLTVTAVGAGSTTISVTASDSGGLTATQSFSITVTGGTQTPQNRAPTAVSSISVPPLQVSGGLKGITVSVDSYFSDPDGDALTYSASSSDSSVASASLWDASLTVTAVGAGTTTIAVTASDSGGLTATQSFSITVTGGTQTPQNQAPTAVSSIPNQTLQVGVSDPTANANSYFSDPDGDALTYSASSSDSSVASASMSGSSLTVTTVGAGSTTITVTASDSGGLTATQSFSITVTGSTQTPQNQAPTLVSSIPNQTVQIGGSLTINVNSYFSDPDNDPLLYSATSANTGVVTVSVSAALVAITPVGAGTTTISVTASDSGGLTATQSFSITVTGGTQTPQNRAPTAVGSISLPSLQVAGGLKGITASVDSYFSDPDGDALTYSASSSDSSIASASLWDASLTVTAVGAGSTTITVTASDSGGLTATQSFSITVTGGTQTPQNQAPTAVSSIPNQTLQAGVSDPTANANSYFSDPDGDALTYSASSSDSSVASASMSGSSLTITTVSAGTTTITITASDSGGLTATQSFSITVTGGTQTPQNQAPTTVSSIPNQTVQIGGNTTVDINSYFSDPDGDLLTYDATSLDTGTASVSESGSVLTITGVEGGPASTTVITVTASDPDGLTATQSFFVTLTTGTGTPQNRAPTAVGSIPAQAVQIGGNTTVNINSYFSDPDGDLLTYDATSLDTGTASVSESGSVLTITGVGGGPAPTTVITVTASDPDGLTAIQSFFVTLTTGTGTPQNRAPTAVGSIPAQTVQAGGADITIDVSSYFSDPDGDLLLYSATSSYTAEATVSVSAALVTITPVFIGTATITVTASDSGGLTATQAFSVSSEVNLQPTPSPSGSGNTPVQASGSIPAQTVAIGGDAKAVDVSGYFTDADGDALVYTVTSSNTNTTTVGVSGSIVSIAPGTTGTATVTVTASDGSTNATQTFSVKVGSAPVAVGTIPNQTLVIGGQITVNVSHYFRSSDGDTLSYKATSSDTSVARVSVSNAAVGILLVSEGVSTISVTASDPDGLTATQTFTVTAKPASAPAADDPLTAAQLQHKHGIHGLEQAIRDRVPQTTRLLRNYPNPFNPETWIPYHLAQASEVRITIYDASGGVVRSLDIGYQSEGYYTNQSRAAYWDGTDENGESVASGLYFYTLTAGDYSATRKMLILK